MGRSDSPLEGRLIFAFGVPRSGTYWLQRILGAHGDVAEVPSETGLFSGGIQPLFEVFHHGARGSQAPGQMYVDRGELLDATRDFCDRVLAGSLDPDARYLSERTAAHVFCVAEIAAVYPDAKLVHIIRDGRDVARSLRGRDWGPSTVREAAEWWRSGIEGARAAAPAGGYTEIRYEELLAEPEPVIRDLYEWLALSAGPDEIAAALTEAALVRNEDPRDRRLEAGKWRDTFSDEDVREFGEGAGQLLEELGYEDAMPAPASTPRPTAKGEPPSRLRGIRQALGRRGRTDDHALVPQIDLVAVQQVVDAVLEAVHTGGVDQLAERLKPDVEGRVITPDGEEKLNGAGALLDWLRAHPLDAARQLKADPYPGVPWYSLVVSYELADGSVEDRVLELFIREGKVEKLTLHRFPR